jgi:hypothetical protein
MYKTNSQAWDEVMQGIAESERRTQICLDMFGQENLKGLSPEQRDLFWASV